MPGIPPATNPGHTVLESSLDESIHASISKTETFPGPYWAGNRFLYRVTIQKWHTCRIMKHIARIAVTAVLLIQQTCLQASEFRLVTYADGRAGGGIRQGADTDDSPDSPGDIFVFDQKLLGEDGETVIGRNAGYCIRTDPGAPDSSGTDHPFLPDDPQNNYGQCTWSIVFDANSGYRGSIVVSGREAELGTSVLPIVGGTGDFLAVPGVLHTTPIRQKDGGMLFRQELVFSRPIGKK